MGSIFGKQKKQSRITEHDQAILKLKKQRDQLMQYQKKIGAILEDEKKLAKKLLREGKKDRAKLLLRKKKHQESLLERTDAQLDNVERLVQDLEFAQVEKKVLEGLKFGNEALKRANEMFSIEEIERIMDDTAEGIAKQQEVDAMLAGHLTPEDEDQVLKELNEMIANDETQKDDLLEPMILPEVPTEKLPDVPTSVSSRSTKSSGKNRVALEA